jgi:flagellar hook assembly protein FlgD
LYQNYPNPFNPETKIEFDVPSKDDNQVFVMLSVFDINGKKVKTLFSGMVEAGHYSVKWNGTNDRGQKLNSGMYFLRFESPSYFKTIKMVMMR